MASGILALTRTGSGYLTGQISWSSVSNGSADNTSTVTATLQIQRSALNTTTGTFKGTFTVGGVSESISWYGTLPSNTWVNIKTITATVSHTADGNGSCYLYAIVNGPTQTTMEGTYVSGSSTVNLDWIPRFASVVSAAAFTDEENPVLTYSNPAGTAVDVLQACISLDGSHAAVSYRDISKTGTNYTFSLTEAERNTLRSATPNSKTLTVYFLILSKIGTGESVHSGKTTMSIVNDTPVISATVVDTNNTTIQLTGNSAILVANHSTASVTLNASAKKYATITGKRVEHGDVVLTDNGTLSPVTNHPIKFTVADSRGNSITAYAPNTIVPYITPTCEIGNGLPEADGSFDLVVTGLCYNGSFGATSNSLSVQYRYKTLSGSYGSWTSFGTVKKSGNKYTATANLTGLNYQTVYTFQARVLDSITAIASFEKRIVAEPVFDWGQNDFRFNVPVAMTKNGLGVYGDELPTAENANNCKANGWYYVGSGTPNAPGGGSGVIRVDSHNNNNVRQTFFSGRATTIGAITMVRELWEGTWGEWCYDNPPMVVGEEYRTTERYKGKPVYVKAVNLGKLPAANAKITISYCSVTATAIRAFAVTSDRKMIPSLYYSASSGVKQERHLFLENNTIGVYCTHDNSSATGVATVWYIKG